MDETGDTDKQALRHQAVLHRNRIHALGTENPDDACAHFFEALRPGAADIVALYWPLPGEFDPGAIMERLLREGVRCALPCVVPGTKILRFALWRDGDALAEGPFGIMQPAEEAEEAVPSIVAVPLLAFDRKGHRLGYGGGYYDATLAALRARGSVTAAGVCYAQQAVLFNLPAEAHDQRLDWVVTPLQAHCFSGKEPA